jgi:hypothetical protein
MQAEQLLYAENDKSGKNPDFRFLPPLRLGFMQL